MTYLHFSFSEYEILSIIFRDYVDTYPQITNTAI